MKPCYNANQYVRTYELCMLEQIYYYHHQPLIAFTDVHVLSIHVLSSVCNFYIIILLDMAVCVGLRLCVCVCVCVLYPCVCMQRGYLHQLNLSRFKYHLLKLLA